MDSALIFVLLVAGTTANLQPRPENVFIAESTTVLKLLQFNHKHVPCFLRIVSELEETNTTYGTRHLAEVLNFRIFHGSYIPTVVQPFSTFDSTESMADETTRLSRIFNRRIQSSTLSHAQFTRCMTSLIPVSAGVISHFDFTYSNYISQEDKFVLIGTEEELKHNMRSKTVLRMRWVIGLILPAEHEKRHEHDSDKTISSQLLYTNCEKLVQAKISDLPSNFGWKSSLSGQHFSLTSRDIAMHYKYDKRSGKRIGLYFAFIDYSSEFYNFTFTISPSKGGTYRFPNGTWPPILDEIAKRNKDFILGLTQYTPKEEIADFSSPLEYYAIQFFTSHPKVGIHEEALLYPFDKLVWILVASSFFGLVACFFGALTMATHLGAMTISEKTFQSVWIPFTIILEQSSRTPVLRGSTALKILTTLGLFVFMVTQTAYGSDLISYLTQPEIIPMPQTFEELSSRKDFKIKFVHFNGTELEFFLRTTIPAYVNIRNRFKYYNTTQMCLMEAFNTTDTACVLYESMGVAGMSSMSISRDRPPLQMSRQPALRIPLSLIYPKFYKYSFEFNSIVSHFSDTGHFLKWSRVSSDNQQALGRKIIKDPENRALYDLIYEKLKETPPVRPFPLKNLQVVFYICVAGLFLAVVTFAIELSWGSPTLSGRANIIIINDLLL